MCVQYLCSLALNGHTGQYSLSVVHLILDTVSEDGVTHGASKRQGVFNIQLSFPKLTRVFYDQSMFVRFMIDEG